MVLVQAQALRPYDRTTVFLDRELHLGSSLQAQGLRLCVCATAFFDPGMAQLGRRGVTPGLPPVKRPLF